MTKTSVAYQSGMSRMNPETAVDWMLVDVDGVELYAELPCVDDDEDANYDDLKAEILDQANAAGIDAAALHFFND